MTSTTVGPRIDRVADRLVVALALGPALGRDDGSPSSTKTLDDEHRLVEQAAAVAAQVEHQALGALAVEALDRLAQLAVRALAEGREANVGDLCGRPTRRISPSTAGTRTSARSTDDLARARRRAAGSDPQLDLGSRRALDPRGRDVGGDAGDRLAVDGDDQVALLDPGALGGRVGEHARDPQPARRPRSR